MTFVYRSHNLRTGRKLKHPVIATVWHDWIGKDGRHWAHVLLSRRIENGVIACVTTVPEAPAGQKE